LGKNFSSIITDIQDKVLKIRMRPLSFIFGQIQRQVKDLSRDLKKKISLQIEGDTIEVDKNFIEKIKDPILHMIRNACDHGIESLEERIKNKKNEIGIIKIDVKEENEHILISISDDGKGLDYDKIRKSALEKAILTKEELEHWNEEKLAGLIFYSGLSTADHVTSLSGRGIGMDIVHKNIKELGGSITVKSQTGKGTHFSLKIPMTLMVVPVLLVRSEQEYFSIPMKNLMEVVEINDHILENNMEIIQNGKILKLRDQLIPLYDLSNLLHLEKMKNESHEFALIFKRDIHFFGIIVSDIYDIMEIVVKKLLSFLNKSEYYVGSSVLGDGRISLVLDIDLLGGKCSDLMSVEKKMMNKKNNNQCREIEMTSFLENRSQIDLSYLIFDMPLDKISAISIESIYRIEKINMTDFSFLKDNVMVTYEGQILPIFNKKDICMMRDEGNKKEKETSDQVEIVVLEKNRKKIGLFVRKVLDIMIWKDPLKKSLSDDRSIKGHLLYEEKLISVLEENNFYQE
jgi:two-component system chemotaxis sensor kinase CheA